MTTPFSFFRVTVLTVLLSMLFFVGGCVSAKQKMLDAGMKSMDDHELQSLFSKPFEISFYSSKKGVTSTVQYYPDGKQILSNSKISDEGTWRIENGEQCSKWKIIRKGAELCTTWIKITDDNYEVYLSDGSNNGMATVIK